MQTGGVAVSSELCTRQGKKVMNRKIIKEISKHLQNKKICGIHFYGAPILILDNCGNIGRELFFTIESDWSIYKIDEAIEWITYPGIGSLLCKLESIMLISIKDVKLDSRKIFYILFENNYVLAIKPSMQYEAWNILIQNDQNLYFISLPGGELSGS